MVERLNQTLETMLALFCCENQWDWDEHVHLLMMAYRSSIHEATKVSPCRMMFGREINLPVDLLFGSPREEPYEPNTDYAYHLSQSLAIIHRFAREHLEISTKRMKKNYDHKANFKRHSPGDGVWLYNLIRKKGRSPKLDCPWKGPYIVTKCLSDVTFLGFQLNPKTKPKVVHYNRLKCYTGENKPTWFQENVNEPVEIQRENLPNDIILLNDTHTREINGSESESDDDNVLEDIEMSLQPELNDDHENLNMETVLPNDEINRRGRKIIKPARFRDFV